jgi:hypothetical protein
LRNKVWCLKKFESLAIFYGKKYLAKFMFVMTLSKAPTKYIFFLKMVILHIINFLVSRTLFFHMHHHYFDLKDLKIKTLNRRYALALSFKLVQNKQKQKNNNKIQMNGVNI